jgi:hypothetical protein
MPLTAILIYFARERIEIPTVWAGFFLFPVFYVPFRIFVAMLPAIFFQRMEQGIIA